MQQPQDLDDPKFDIVRIGACHYRKLVIDEDLTFKGEEYHEEEEEVEGELDNDIHYDENEWVMKLTIPAVFHKFIVGKGAKTKQKLEMDSGARIIVPRSEDNEDIVTLRARHKQMIYSAKAQIELLCEREESKLEYTHFLSVPLAHDLKFKQKVDTFQENVVLQRFDGVDHSIFMPARRMHFTLCMLKLHSHALVEVAKEALEEFAAGLVSTAEYERPLVAHLRGLHIMTDDPSSVSLIFTTDRSNALQNRMNSMSDTLFAILKEKNVVAQQNLMSQRLLSSDGSNAEVKLHATLMNTKYSKAFNRNERGTFDASAIMESFGHVDFGVVPMREIKLSCLEEMGDDGYYRSLASCELCNPKSFA